jgi:SAM-dependent methyltransferase
MDRHHLHYVGPPDEYDLRGSSQFSLLCALGLRRHHRLLDIGCGSLRAGRLFIPYLAAGGYTGLEPNRWLVEGAIDELGPELLKLQQAEFAYNDNFEVSGLGSFDFVLAQSIASHTGPEMTLRLLASVQEALSPTGVAAVTFVHGGRDTALEGWFYPDVTPYQRTTISRWIQEAGLAGVPLRWFHPRQTWWAIAHGSDRLPPRSWRTLARGPMLAYPRSWNAAARLRAARPVRRARRRLSRSS